MYTRSLLSSVSHALLTYLSFKVQLSATSAVSKVISYSLCAHICSGERASPVSLKLTSCAMVIGVHISLLYQPWALQNSQDLSRNFCTHPAPGPHKALSCAV